MTKPVPAIKERLCFRMFDASWPIESIEVTATGALEVEFEMVKGQPTTVVILPSTFGEYTDVTADWRKVEAE